MRKVNGPVHRDTLSALGGLANSYAAAGRQDEALKLREELLALRRKVLGPEHPDTIDAMSNLAHSYAAAGRQDEALKMREEVLALSRKVLGPEHPATLSAMNNVAWTLATSPDAALRDPKRSVELAAQAAKLEPKNANKVGTLGTAQYRAGDFAAAISTLQNALSLGKEDGAAHNRFFLAMARWQAGDKEQARKDYDQAVAAMEKAKGKSAPQDEENLRFQKEAAALLTEPGEARK